MTGKTIRFQTEIVNGICPTCEEMTMLVGITPEMYRCISCGADLQQHVNGKYKLHTHNYKQNTYNHK